MNSYGLDFAKIERNACIRERVLPVLGIIYWIVLPVVFEFHLCDWYMVYCAAPIVLFVGFLVFMKYFTVWRRKNARLRSYNQ